MSKEMCSSRGPEIWDMRKEWSIYPLSKETKWEHGKAAQKFILVEKTISV
jgi:hypothetical protein